MALGDLTNSLHSLEWSEPLSPTFMERLTATVQDAVLLGVKWLIVSILALFGVGWVLSDYAFVREQARYVAAVRQQAAQQQAAPARPPTATPTPGGP